MCSLTCVCRPREKYFLETYEIMEKMAADEEAKKHDRVS
jgi:hypothetical protein